MNNWWRKYAVRIDALAPRERVLVFIAAVAVALFMMKALFVDPPMARIKANLTRTAQQQAAVQTLQQQIQAMEQKLAAPDAANLAQRDDIRRQIAEIDETLKGMERSLVPARTMKSVLQGMLVRNPRLKLVAIRTLPVAPLVEKPDSAGKPAAVPSPASREKFAAGESNVFKHGVQITLQGSYADLHDYLTRLEGQPWRMYWSRASLNADDYPRLKLTVTIYTLSLDKAWLVV